MDKKNFWKRVVRFLLTAIFLFGLFPDPFLWMIDEIISWAALVCLISYSLILKYKEIKKMEEESFTYLYDDLHK